MHFLVPHPKLLSLKSIENSHAPAAGLVQTICNNIINNNRPPAWVRAISGDGKQEYYKSWPNNYQRLSCIIAARANANNEEADQLPSSEEERTPSGGGTKQELVGYCYKIVRLNDAQLVIPQLAPTPPNMVAGCCRYGMDIVGSQRKSFDNDGCESAW